MKVKELIEKLEKENGEKEVKYSSYGEMCLMSLSGVVYNKKEDIVEIEGD